MHGAGDVSSNRWLSCSHPRVGYRLTIFDAGLPLSKNGYLSHRTPRVHLSLAAISSVLHRQSVVQPLGGDRCFPRYNPNEPCQFSGDCCDHTGLGFSCAAQMAVPFTQTGLCLPADILDLLWQVRGSFKIRMPFLWRMPVRPSRFDQHCSG